jgi:hypothetical protein
MNMPDSTWKKAEALGHGPQKLDVKADYKNEVTLAMQNAIARAWADRQYKQQLIANPAKQLADLGVYFPDRYDIEFYDDPSAKVGDWATTGKGDTSTLRIPIPPAPAGGHLAADELIAPHAAADDCCCSCLCCCTGAASPDSFY